MKRFTLILGVFSLMWLAGCTVGPRYTRAQRTDRAGRHVQRNRRLETGATERSTTAWEVVGDFRRSAVERTGE